MHWVIKRPQTKKVRENVNKLTVQEGGGEKKQKRNPVTVDQPLATISHHDAAQLLPARRAAVASRSVLCIICP